ncbi:protein of unknown function [Xenorhabdus poinarii G6]|uniref:Uncharacterized protein n=1 Tax=Xenorhabdus poinarii G6 TaxID=1354304 RepID=A0A068R059_9GAMM|nr:protein of unknown function [Xenorhabdus poinarii G6]
MFIFFISPCSQETIIDEDISISSQSTFIPPHKAREGKAYDRLHNACQRLFAIAPLKAGR